VAIVELLQLYVIRKARLTRLIQLSLQQPLQHGTVVAVFLCPASFIPATVIVTDPHSTKFGSLSLISPGHLTVSECQS